MVKSDKLVSTTLSV